MNDLLGWIVGAVLVIGIVGLSAIAILLGIFVNVIFRKD